MSRYIDKDCARATIILNQKKNDQKILLRVSVYIGAALITAICVKWIDQVFLQAKLGGNAGFFMMSINN